MSQFQWAYLPVSLFCDFYASQSNSTPHCLFLSFIFHSSFFRLIIWGIPCNNDCHHIQYQGHKNNAASSLTLFFFYFFLWLLSKNPQVGVISQIKKTDRFFSFSSFLGFLIGFWVINFSNHNYISIYISNSELDSSIFISSQTNSYLFWTLPSFLSFYYSSTTVFFFLSCLIIMKHLFLMPLNTIVSQWPSEHHRNTKISNCS